MQVIPATTITDAIFTSSTVPETVAATYSGATTYGAGALTGAAPVYGSPQIVCKSLSAGNLGNPLPVAPATATAFWQKVGEVYPVYASGSSCGVGGIVSNITTNVHELYTSQVAGNTGNALTDTTKWKLTGVTNKWAMFDYTRNVKTTAPLTFTSVFAPGRRCNSLGLKGIVANSYSLLVTSAAYGGTIYSSSGSLNTRITLGWYDYFFGEFTTQESLAFFDIPPYSDAIFTLTLTSTSGDASLAACVVGSYVYLGVTQWSAVSDALNFSSITRDTFGNATLVPRRSVPKTSQQVACDKSRVNKVRKVREGLNAVPALWYGLDNGTDGYFDALSILGIYKQFSINVDLPVSALITLELEEI